MKFFNGKYVEMTAGELSGMNKVSAREEAADRHRLLTESEVLSLLLKQQVNTLVADNQTAFRMREFYTAWAAGGSCAVGYKVQFSGKLWRCLQAHTHQEGREPENAPALWEKICQDHDGARYHPIPCNGSMALVSGLYYSQDGVTYFCKGYGESRLSPLRELVGIYVEQKGE